MRILYGKCFGLGNAVMAVPAIKALHSMGHRVDVLVGTGPDDIGAFEVLFRLKNFGTKDCIENIWINATDQKYDLAIMAIPFDGRWKNGVHFFADEVVDGRTRPDPSTTGLVSWKKHEIEYQMDNVFVLGYKGEIPDCSFLGPSLVFSETYYLGLGYKKDAAGFWKIKHWGNENYARLVSMILEDKNACVITTGDMADLQLSIRPIEKLVNNVRFHYEPGGLVQSFKAVAESHIYVGNDTGMMHVAASVDRKVVGMFMLQNSVTKARPWCSNYSCVEPFDLQGNPRTISVEEVYKEIQEMREICRKNSL